MGAGGENEGARGGALNRVDVTIIGGGPVGLFAAFYAGMRGMSARIIDSLPELGGQLTALYPEKYVYDMPGFPKVLAKDLAAEMIAQGLEFGPEVVLGQTATALVKDEQGYLVSTSAASYPTRTVIISAGAGAFSPSKLGIEREDDFIGKGLSYGVREKEAFRGKQVAIVGGGDSAFDWCLELEKIASKITLIHRRDQFRAHEDSVRQVMASSVQMRLWCAVKELIGEDRLEGVEIENSQTKERERLEVDALIVNVGFKSSLGPLKDWGIAIEKNQIVVDSRYETNLPGVFAVGDVASFPSKIKLIATGVGEAATAVCFAKTYLDPTAKLFPGHSSDMELGLG
jgi:thioredoxin reductase